MPYIRYTTPQGGTQWVSLHEVTVIGRGKDCELVLDDTMASRRHAQVKKVGASYILSDLESKNGTFVNGAQVSTWTLKDGDLIAIGNSTMLFKVQK